MTDTEFVRAFEECTLSAGSFRHADHVRLAWLYLRDKPFAAAQEAFCSGLQRFATANGKPDRYHATITLAYLLLIHERRGRLDPNHTWEEFTFANADLLDWKDSVLKKYYRDETLASDFARRVFVFPDRALA